MPLNDLKDLINSVVAHIVHSNTIINNEFIDETILHFLDNVYDIQELVKTKVLEILESKGIKIESSNINKKASEVKEIAKMLKSNPKKLEFLSNIIEHSFKNKEIEDSDYNEFKHALKLSNEKNDYESFEHLATISNEIFDKTVDKCLSK